MQLSNAGEVSPGLMTDNLDLLVAQDHRTQCLSNDDAAARARTEGKAMDDFHVALADTFEAAFVSTENGEERTASKPEGFQPVQPVQSGLTAACSFGRPGVKHQRDIDNTALDSTHGLKKRKPTVNKKLHQCPVCDASFDRPSKLARHSIIHTSERPFRCGDCDYCCKSQHCLVRHQKNCHVDKNLYKCDECHQSFSTNENLLRHKQLHDTTRPYRCDICDVRFKTRSACQSHAAQHDDQCSYECNLCSRTFKTKMMLDQHQSVHSNIKNFHCECGTSYKSRRALVAHRKIKHSELKNQKLTHNEKKTYQCSVCSKIFCRKQSLNDHVTTHTGKKSFLCDICGCLFRKRKTLVCHQKSYHGNEQFQCDECHRIFPNSTGFRNHKKLHDPERPYQCKVCNLRFAKKTVCHMHTHNQHYKEGSHVCEDCGKKLSTKTLLIRHQVVHKDNRDFHCVYCAGNYKSMDTLKKHMKKKHPGLKCKTKSTNTGGAVITQSPLVIDQPSTSGAYRNDSVTEERLNKLFDASNRIFSGHGESERSDRSCIDNSSASASASGSASDSDSDSGSDSAPAPDSGSDSAPAPAPVVNIDETNEHKKQEIIVDSPGKGKHGMSESLEEQTVNNGAVVSQSPSVINQPSTSATGIDLMAEEDLDNVFDGCLNDLCCVDGSPDRLNKFNIGNFLDSAVGPDANETSKYKKVIVDSYGKHEQDMSELLEKQTADVGAVVVSQPPSAMDDLLSEKYLEELVYRYTRDLLDGNDGLFNESGEPDNNTLSDQSYPSNRQADTLTRAEKITRKKH